MLRESFVRVLELARELKLAQFGQITVSADGTKKSRLHTLRLAPQVVAAA